MINYQIQSYSPLEKAAAVAIAGVVMLTPGCASRRYAVNTAQNIETRLGQRIDGQKNSVDQIETRTHFADFAIVYKGTDDYSKLLDKIRSDPQIKDNTKLLIDLLYGPNAIAVMPTNDRKKFEALAIYETGPNDKPDGKLTIGQDEVYGRGNIFYINAEDLPESVINQLINLHAPKQNDNNSSLKINEPWKYGLIPSNSYEKALIGKGNRRNSLRDFGQSAFSRAKPISVGRKV